MEPQANLVQQLTEARTCTDRLFAMLRPDSLYERPIPERHRIIFYLGHVEAFDWNLICRNSLGIPSFQAELDQLFAFGIDPPAGQLPNDQPKDWPTVAKVQQYNHKVRKVLDETMQEDLGDVLHIAIEHRLMHAETFTYILHTLSSDRKSATASNPQHVSPEPVHTQIEIPGGSANLGRRRQDRFGWDNEYEPSTVPVPSFAISKYKVTNRQYLEFVHSGGTAPHFWDCRGDQWFWRGMFGLVPLPLDWPVYVTYEQALAYATWRGQSLPTEAQFHRAAYGTPQGAERPYPWGEDPPCSLRGNLDFSQWDPIAVTASPQGDSAFGVSQLVGNGWEWTATEFHPFPGFQPYALYPGYSARFFDGSHQVLKGASPRTAARLVRRSFRNWFRSGYAYAYAAFRCVES